MLKWHSVIIFCPVVDVNPQTLPPGSNFSFPSPSGPILPPSPPIMSTPRLGSTQGASTTNRPGGTTFTAPPIQTPKAYTGPSQAGKYHPSVTLLKSTVVNDFNLKFFKILYLCGIFFFLKTHSKLSSDRTKGYKCLLMLFSNYCIQSLILTPSLFKFI